MYKGLSTQCEDGSSYPQDPHKIWVGVQPTCNSSTQETETGGFLKQTG